MPSGTFAIWEGMSLHLYSNKGYAGGAGFAKLLAGKGIPLGSKYGKDYRVALKFDGTDGVLYLDFYKGDGTYVESYGLYPNDPAKVYLADPPKDTSKLGSN
jgi:hypothetical protein